MRDIRFRAWDKVNNKMLSHKDMLDGSWDNWPTLFFAITDNDIYIPMQFTGLHDKNGKEIYEGDLIKFYIEDCQDIEGISEVIFREGCFTITAEKDYWPCLDAVDVKYREVIGNIYENPVWVEIVTQYHTGQ
jgi:uncharacterized phage protein (TIGR01671 family)